MENIRKLTEKEDKELADSVLQVSIEANRPLVDELMGDDGMCEALIEIMKPQLQQREQTGIREGLRMGIQGTVDALREFGHSDCEIKATIIRKYDLSDEEVEKYLN